MEDPSPVAMVKPTQELLHVTLDLERIENMNQAFLHRHQLEYLNI